MKGIDKNVNPEETLVRMIASCGEVWEEENEMGRIAVDVSEFSKREVRTVAITFAGFFFEDDEAFHLVLHMKTFNAHRGSF